MPKTGKEIFSIIKRTLKYGILLTRNDLLNPEKYLLDMCAHINDNTKYRALLYRKNKILIETYNSFPILQLQVEEDTMLFTPLGDDDFFDLFMKVMEYVAKKEINQTKRISNDNEFDWV